MKNVDLSVIILNYNTRELLKDCLCSLIETIRHMPYTIELIVVDNGSTDGSVESVKELFINELKGLKKKQLVNSLTRNKLIINKTNLGFTKANNQALAQAQGKFCLLLNSDTKVVNDGLRKLINFAERKKDLGVAGPKLLNADGTPQPSCGPFYNLLNTAIALFGGERIGLLRKSPEETTEVDWVSGACFLISRKALEKIGFLDEDFFMYMEEVEWCYRVKRAGFKVFFYPKAEIFHLVRGSSIRGKTKAILGIYKGLILFYQKHKPFWQLPILKLMLKTKAILAWLIGILTANSYLKETYAQAYRVA